MATINIGGQEIPAIAIAVALPVLAALYVADAAYFGFVSGETLMAAQDAIVQKEAGVEEKHHQAQELKERTKQIDAIKAETAALEKSITLLKSKIPSEAQVPVLLYDIERMAKAAEGNLRSFEPGQMKPYGSGPGAAPIPAPPPPPAPKPKPAAKPAADKGEGDGGAEGGAGDAEGGGGAKPAAKAPPPPPPPPRPATADILEMPVTIHAEATYPQVIKFLDQLSTYERKLNVSNLQLTPAAGGSSGGGAADSKQAAVFKNTLGVEFTVSAYVLKKSGGQP
jgi:Tfp pilus assembly protein PilO